jgi:hypothetical protein
MSELVRPRQIKERKQSQARDSSARRVELRNNLHTLVKSRGYEHLKKAAIGIAFMYRSEPGRTVEENVSYLTHCNILWAFNMLWKSVEDIAKESPKENEENANDGW